MIGQNISEMLLKGLKKGDGRRIMFGTSEQEAMKTTTLVAARFKIRSVKARRNRAAPWCLDFERICNWLEEEDGAMVRGKTVKRKSDTVTAGVLNLFLT